MEEFQDFYIFADTNADYNNLQNTLRGSNEHEINKFINTNKLFQHNKQFANSSYSGSDRVIDHVFSRKDNCSEEYGGHLGVKEYHPALLTTIKFDKDVSSVLSNVGYCENPIQDSSKDNIETKIRVTGPS